VTSVKDNILTAIDTETHAIKARVSVGNFPRGMSYDALTKRIYVATTRENTVTVLDGATYQPLAKIEDLLWPMAFGNFIVH
jgi:YVTN family beta-propeller protein